MFEPVVFSDFRIFINAARILWLTTALLHLYLNPLKNGEVSQYHQIVQKQWCAMVDQLRWCSGSYCQKYANVMHSSIVSAC